MRACEGHQQDPPHHPAHRGQHLVPVGHLRDDPARVPRQGPVIEVGPFPGDGIPEFDAADPMPPPDGPVHGRVHHQARHILHGPGRNPLLPGAGDQPPVPGEHETEAGGIVRTDIQGVAEPGQVDVHAADGRETARPVPDGIGVGGQLLDRVRAIGIRIAPEFRLLPERPLEVGSERIVVVGTGDLVHQDPALFLVGIGLEEPAFGRIVIRQDGDARTCDARIALDHPHGRPEQGIRVGQALLDAPFILVHRQFRLLQGMEDDLGLQGQFHPRNPLFLPDQDVAGIGVLQGRDQLQQEGRQEDEDQAGPLPLIEKSADTVDERSHSDQSSKKRKESRIRKIMSTYALEVSSQRNPSRCSTCMEKTLEATFSTIWTSACE